MVTGRRFYGDDATEETVMDFVLSDRPLPNMDGIERDVAVLIRKVLNRDPSKRWSSRRAFKTEVLRPSEDFIATAPKNEPVIPPIPDPPLSGKASLGAIPCMNRAS